MKQLSAEYRTQKGSMPGWVKNDVANYLTLRPESGCIDPEEREWSLLATAEQLKIILAGRNTDWRIPLIEHRIRLYNDANGSPQQELTLLLRLHPKLTWEDYETAVKASLKLRKDFWVVRTRFETIRKLNCLSQQLKGSRAALREEVAQCIRLARENGFHPADYYFIIPHNDEEQVAEKELLTTILVPVQQVE